MRKKPDLSTITRRSLATASDYEPPVADVAAQAALARAAEAASGGQTRKADRESRLAERLARLARSEAQYQADLPGMSLRELQRRVNIARAEERAALDAFKARDPVNWRKAYEEAREAALAHVEAMWIGEVPVIPSPPADEPDSEWPQRFD